jgi:hypothetical protein
MTNNLWITNRPCSGCCSMRSCCRSLLPLTAAAHCCRSLLPLTADLSGSDP